MASVDEGHGKTSEILTGTQGSNENGGSQIEIDCGQDIYSVAFLTNGNDIVGGGKEETIRRWRGEDGNEVGEPMATGSGSGVSNVAVSRDGKWIVSGTTSGQVMIWNSESHAKENVFGGHDKDVYAVDVSPDATTIATGLEDRTVCVWSFTGQRLLGPLKHDWAVPAVRFSPDGRLLATATWDRESVRIYDIHDGRLLADAPIRVNSPFNQSLAWLSNSREIFALSHDRNIHHLDVFAGRTLSKWAIRRNSRPECIVLASNGAFVAASTGSAVSFWDTTTHDQICSVIRHPANVWSMAISENYDLVLGGERKITLRCLFGVVPSCYMDDHVSVSPSGSRPVRYRSLTNRLVD